MNELERVEAAALRDAVVLAGGRAALVGGALCVAHDEIPIRELNRVMPIGDSLALGLAAATAGVLEGARWTSTRSAHGTGTPRT